MKLLSLGFLTLVLGFSVACGNSNSSKVDLSSEEVSSEVSSEDTNKEPVYSIDIGGTTTLLTKVSDDIYELEITATAVSEFKIVIVKADDVNYVEKWIGNNGDSNFQIQPGTYKVIYKVSTKTVTCVAK